MDTKKIYGPWIKWRGGARPVPPETLVKVRLRDGTVEPVRAASELCNGAANTIDDLHIQLAEAKHKLIVKEAQLAEARENAERWRIFREASLIPFDDKHPLSVLAERLVQGISVSAEDVDAAIDAVRESQHN